MEERKVSKAVQKQKLIKIEKLCQNSIKFNRFVRSGVPPPILCRFHFEAGPRFSGFLHQL
jgi:hypothetical protein